MIESDKRGTDHRTEGAAERPVPSTAVGRDPGPNAGIVSMIRRLFVHLSPRRRRQFVLLGILVLAGAAAELATIGALVPFIALLASPEQFQEYAVIRGGFEFMGWTDPTEAVVPMAVAFTLIILLAGLVRLGHIWASTRFVFAVGRDLSVEAYERILHQPYEFHTQTNSSEVQACLNKIQMVASRVVQPLVRSVSALAIALAIITALLLVNAVLTLLVFGSLFGMYLIFSRLVRRVLASNGSVIARAQGRRIQMIQEGVGGIRDVILDSVQREHTGMFGTLEARMRNAQCQNTFVSEVPRHVIEILGILLLTGVAVVLAGSDSGLEAALPSLGALALGAQRLMPQAQSLYSGWSNLASSRAVLADVLFYLELPIDSACRDDIQIDPMPFDREIRIEAVGFCYSEGKRPVLEGVDLVVPRGSRIGITGRTGSGKSTLLDLLMGLLPPTEGRVLVDGHDIWAGSVAAWRKRIAHVPQHIFLLDASVEANIAFGVAPERIEPDRVRRAAAAAEIESFIQSLPEGYATRVGERGARFSGGERQRLGIARALYKNADVLILDEATSAIDDDTAMRIMDNIQRERREQTLIVVTHNRELIRACSERWRVAGGTVEASA